MLNLILDVCAATAVTLALIALLRTRRRRYYDISATEIHSDFAADQELLEDARAELALLEGSRLKEPSAHS